MFAGQSSVSEAACRGAGGRRPALRFLMIIALALSLGSCAYVPDRLRPYFFMEPRNTPPPSPVELAASAETQEPGYTLSPGDQLEISVWKEEALTKVVTVLPDGKISFPLAGELTAAGRTVAEIKEELTEKLKPYVPVPVISVEVKQVNSVLIYVIGKVNNPGRFVHNTNVTVLQALATAGGLNPFAKRNRIKIFRPGGGNHTLTFYFRYDDVAEGKYMEQNIRLRKGDVVVVP